MMDKHSLPLDESLQILTQLVGFPTVSSSSNLALLDYVQALLSQHSVAYERVLAKPATATADDQDKANLLAIIGDKNIPAIALSGHTDVVPVTGQDWSRDPFILHIESDKAYGRGTCDMKGFLACVLAMLPYFTSLSLRQPIMLCFSYDEEVGCRGVKHLIDYMQASLPAPEAVIVGEPSQMRTLSAHKSLLLCHTEITGTAGHSSAIHRGVSANVAAAKMMSEIDRMMHAHAAEAQSTAKHVHMPAFDPPFTTLHIGMMRGGYATNIIANHAEFFWDIRSLPDENPHHERDHLMGWAEKNLLPDMQKIHPQSAIVTHTLSDLPAFRYQEDSAAEQLVRSISGDNSLNFASYMAEAGLFQQAGFPTIIYGPGDIAQAHQPDEWISLEQMQQCLLFLYQLGQHLSKV